MGLTEELAALRQERAELAQKQFLAELNGLLQAVRELLDQRQREELAQLMRTLGDPCQGFGAVRMMEELLTWINVQLLAVIEQLQQIGSMLGQQAKLDLLLGDVEPGQLRTWLAQQEIDDLRALVDDLVQLKEE